MNNGLFKVPRPINELTQGYLPGSPERKGLKEALQLARETTVEVPQYIGADEVYSGKKERISPPHDHQHTLGYFHQGDASHVEAAINAALEAAPAWGALAWEQRASVFLKAADLIAGPYRHRINAATMLGQSKNAYQAEIDSACELIDFLRFNVSFMAQLYADQPVSSPGIWNRVEYRPLEGFVFALTPFNFTAIAGNLCAAPALMGNVVVWKPAFTQVYAAYVLMEVFKEAGLPAGVINMILVDGPEAGEVVFKHKEFAGLHFTGSTGVFRTIWQQIADNIGTYRSFPRIVGETGGKDFVLVHTSASAKAVATGLIRGAFEYQGQKCSAASRAYVPSNRWEEIKGELLNGLELMTMGGVEDFSHFVNAVIDERSFDKIVGYIEQARTDGVNFLWGGTYSKEKGYFIEPTILVTSDALYRTMREEIFGPVLTIYIYDPSQFDEMVDRVDKTSGYALTGALFAADRDVISKTTQRLLHSAGNFYINDKPTGAVVGQQPFGGARASGTNDKAGSMQNLLRWVSPRTIKETFVSPEDFRYPFMQEP
jgi:1-pyrroline-5-carboxylate dehydrogenase